MIHQIVFHPLELSTDPSIKFVFNSVKKSKQNWTLKKGLDLTRSAKFMINLNLLATSKCDIVSILSSCFFLSNSIHPLSSIHLFIELVWDWRDHTLLGHNVAGFDCIFWKGPKKLGRFGWFESLLLLNYTGCGKRAISCLFQILTK